MDIDDKFTCTACLWHRNELCDSHTRSCWKQQATCAEEIHAQGSPKLNPDPCHSSSDLSETGLRHE